MAFLDYNGLTHYNNNLNEKFNTKANVDGAYEGMTVGNAEQLISSVYTEDSVPYLFRTSGGSADIGDREFDEIVGGTLAWNQVLDDTRVEDMGGSNPTNKIIYPPVGSSIISGHKYLFSCQLTNTENLTNKARVLLFTNANGSNVTIGAIRGNVNGYEYALFNSSYNAVSDGSSTTDGKLWIYMDVNNTDGKATVSKMNLIDLTLMFGSTIADYIYSLEQSTSGSGVAFFRKFFNKPYYSYNSGELISSFPTAHETVGFNAWDEEWEVGGISDSTGIDYSTNNAIRSKNYIPVVPNAVYYFKSPTMFGLRFYDADKTFISSVTLQNATYTIPNGVCYIRFNAVNRNTYSNDICINLSWDGERDGEYEPYVKHTYPISSVQMHGIWKLDANNKIYCDGDIRKADGTLERRYGIVDLGTLTWAYYAPRNNFYADISDAKSGSYSNIANISCSNYVATSWGDIYADTADDKSMAMYNQSGRIYIKDTAYSDAQAFKTAMSGVYLVYELAEPTTETVDTFASPQIVDDFGTEEYVDTRAVPIPVGHNTKYTQNLRAKVEMSPDSPADNGDYLLRHANDENEYVPYIDRIPSAPSDNGTYVLKCTVNGSTISYTWVAE